jgi:hypothetical protein
MTGKIATNAINNGNNELDWSSAYGSTTCGPLVLRLRFALVCLATGSSSSSSSSNDSSGNSIWGMGGNLGISKN